MPTPVRPCHCHSSNNVTDNHHQNLLAESLSYLIGRYAIVEHENIFGDQTANISILLNTRPAFLRVELRTRDSRRAQNRFLVLADGLSGYERIKRRAQFSTPLNWETGSVRRNAPAAPLAGKMTSHHAG